MADIQNINALIQLSGGTEAEWNLTTVPIPAGVLVYATDTKNFKLGNGATIFSELPVFFNLGDAEKAKEFVSNFPTIDATAAGKVIVINEDGTGYALSGITFSELVVLDTLTSLLEQKAALNHTHNTSEVTGLGTAALKNTGLTAGTVPVIGTNGKFDTSIVPVVPSDSLEQENIISYLLVAQLADDDAALLNLPNGWADAFETSEGIDAGNSANVIFNINQYEGTDITLTSVAKTFSVSPTVVRLYFTCETTAIVNSEILAEVTRDGGTTWAAVILNKNVMSSGVNSIFTGECAFDTVLQTNNTAIDNVEVEDVKGDNTSFTVDTANTSGHFNTALSGNYTGFKITTPSGEVTILTIDGSGTTENSVTIFGTLAVGSHIVTSIVGLDTTSGVKIVDSIYDNKFTQMIPGTKIVGRQNHICVKIGTKLYIHGGINGTVPLRDTWEYDTETSIWKQLSSSSAARYGHSAVVIDDEIYIFGGNNGVDALNTLLKYNPETDTWSTLLSGATARHFHVAATVGTKMYIFGGLYNSTYYNDLWCYEANTNVWTQLTSGATARSMTAVAVIDDKLYIFGGHSDATNAMDDLWVYDTTIGNWSELTAGATGRYGHTMAMFANKLYIFNGYDGTAYLDDMWYYDTANLSWSAQMTGTAGHYGSTAVIVFSEIFIFGGHNDTQDRSTLLKYSVGNDVWNEVITFMPTRSRHTSVLINGKMYVFGGYDGVDYSNELFCYNTSSGIWTKLTSGATVRYDHTAVAVGTKMYIFGGRDSTGSLADLWSYETTTDTWTELTADTILRGRHSAVVIGTRMYVYGGYSVNDTAYVNDLRYYDTETNTWTALATNLAVRCFHTAVAIGTDMYVFGGISSGTMLSELWKYDTVAEDWSQLTSRAYGSYMTSSVAIGTKMYVFGGYSGSGGVCLDDLWYYDTVSGTWTELNSDYQVRELHTAVTDGSDIYIFGGDNGTSQLSNISIYNLTNAIWSIPLSELHNLARRYHASTTIGTKMYIFCGMDNTGARLKDTWVLDTATKRLTKLANSGATLTSPTACAIGTKIYLFGGYDGSSVYNILQCYNVTANQWSTLSIGPASRYGAVAIAVDSKMYIFGGYNNTANLNTAWVYDPTYDSWAQLTNLPVAVRFAAISAIGTKIYIYGGYTSTAIASLIVYDIATNTYSNLTAGPAAIYGHQMIAMSDKLYVFCGTTNSELASGVYAYDTTTDTWETITSEVIVRTTFTIGVVDSEIYLFGGLTTFGVVTANLTVCEIYPPINGSSVAITTTTITNPIRISTTDDLSDTYTALLIANEYQIYLDGAWKTVVRENGGMWQYLNGSSQWITSPINSAPAAFSKALLFESNQWLFSSLLEVASNVLSVISIDGILLQLNANDAFTNLSYISAVTQTIPEGTQIAYRIRTVNDTEAIVKDVRVKLP